MTPMQEKFEKEFNRKECLNAGGGWYHDAVKAFIGRAEIESKIEAQIEVLGNLREKVKYHYKSAGAGVQVSVGVIEWFEIQLLIDRLKAELKGET